MFPKEGGVSFIIQHCAHFADEVRRGHLDCLLAVSGRQHRVATSLEAAPNQFPQPARVLYQENRFAAARHVFSNNALEHFAHVADDITEVQGLVLQDLLAAESQQLPG
jgi:hypothetical protein